MDHPAIEHLAGTPDILRYLLTGVSENQTNWKPAADRWSLAELLSHLSHVEGHVFRQRIDLIMGSDNPEFESYDEREHDARGVYSNRDAEESLAHWEEQREDNVEFLRDLPQSALSRAGEHRPLGRMTVAGILSAWAFHDLGHIRQVAELVRAQLYYPELGVLKGEKKVSP